MLKSHSLNRRICVFRKNDFTEKLVSERYFAQFPYCGSLTNSKAYYSQFFNKNFVKSNFPIKNHCKLVSRKKNSCTMWKSTIKRHQAQKFP